MTTNIESLISAVQSSQTPGFHGFGIAVCRLVVHLDNASLDDLDPYLVRVGGLAASLSYAHQDNRALLKQLLISYMRAPNQASKDTYLEWIEEVSERAYWTRWASDTLMASLHAVLAA